MRCKAVKIHLKDNVAIIATKGGLKAGTEIQDGVTLLEDIAQGHKVALIDLPQGQEIIRYGELIGYSTQDLPRGSLIREEHVLLPELPSLSNSLTAPQENDLQTPKYNYTFKGYRNQDGTVGTKNVFAIMTSVQCVAGVADFNIFKTRARKISRKGRRSTLASQKNIHSPERGRRPQGREDGDVSGHNLQTTV